MIRVEPASRPGKHRRIALDLPTSGRDDIPDEVMEPLTDHSTQNSSDDEIDSIGHKDTSNRKRGRSSK